MSVTNVPRFRNVLFRFVNLPVGFRSLRTIPFLIVLAGSFTIQPAVRADTVVATIAVGGGLEGIVASPDGSTVYVADSNGERVGVIDAATNQVSFYISTANHPIGLGLSPDGNTLYVTEDQTVAPFNGFLEVISLTTLKQVFIETVGSSPAIPGISSDGNTIYVPCQTAPGTVVAVTGPLAPSTITVGGNAAVDVVFNQNNTRAYVTTLSKKIAVINTKTGSVSKIATTTLTFGLAINNNTNTLYATGVNTVFAIDTKSNTVIATIKVPTPPGNFLLTLPALTPDGLFLYAGVAQKTTSPPVSNNTVVVIDTSTNTVVGKPTTVGEVPIQIATTLNDYGYSSNAHDGTVTVFLPPPAGF